MAENTFVAVELKVTDSPTVKELMGRIVKAIVENKHIGYSIDGAFVSEVDGSIQYKEQGNFVWINLNHISGSVIQIYIESTALCMSFIPPLAPIDDYINNPITGLSSGLLINDAAISGYPINFIFAIDSAGDGLWIYVYNTRPDIVFRKKLILMGSYIADFCYPQTEYNVLNKLILVDILQMEAFCYDGSRYGQSTYDYSNLEDPSNLSRPFIQLKNKGIISPLLVLNNADLNYHSPYAYISTKSIARINWNNNNETIGDNFIVDNGNYILAAKETSTYVLGWSSLNENIDLSDFYD